MDRIVHQEKPDEIVDSVSPKELVDFGGGGGGEVDSCLGRGSGGKHVLESTFHFVLSETSARYRFRPGKQVAVHRVTRRQSEDVVDTVFPTRGSHWQGHVFVRHLSDLQGSR